MYAFGIKFMDEAERKIIQEVLKMTEIGFDFLEEAVYERDIEIAKNALRKDITVEIVMDITGLDEATVLKIQEELQDN